MTTGEQRERNKTLALYDGPDKVERASTILEQERAKPQTSFYPTGFGILDRHIKGGFYPGQMVVISGTTGHGKTTLAQSITANLIGNTPPVWPLWFSYEVIPQDFLEQFDSKYLPWFYMPRETTNGNLKWVEDRIIESFLKYGTKTVFIDHLHRVIDMNSKDNMSVKVGAAVIELKKMALRNGMVIVLICHTTKTNSTQEDELNLGDVRDSSFIEQEADTVLYCWRKRDEDNVTVMKIAKNRKGGTINRRILLQYEHGRYYEQSGQSENTAGNNGTSGRGRSGVGSGMPDELSQRERSRYGE